MRQTFRQIAFAGVCVSFVTLCAQAEEQPASLLHPNDIKVKKLGPMAAPNAETVRTRNLEWVAQRSVTDQTLLKEIGALWVWTDEPPAAEGLFELTTRTFALVDEATRKFLAACGLQHAPLVPPDGRLLEQESLGSFYTANMNLYYGRYLAHRQMFEEALEVLSRVQAADVVDPASLLFFKAVCQHHLLMKMEGLETIEQLLRNTEGVPVRYSTVATLMQYDLEALKDQSLDEVARKMTDVERRLELGRTGEKVQKREEEIITALDELIKRQEEQQNGGGGGQGGQANRSASPAQDSGIKGSTAPGQVDPKKLKDGGEWGDLPAKARSKVKDRIGRQFPAHYKDATEAYSKKEANRPAVPGK
ncbi:MAG: hypothetical protein JSS02_31980 [Planctomycetes bacterium]|nr:hypothetical protein [Planctomycetota bacterium]